MKTCQSTNILEVRERSLKAHRAEQRPTQSGKLHHLFRCSGNRNQLTAVLCDRVSVVVLGSEWQMSH